MGDLNHNDVDFLTEIAGIESSGIAEARVQILQYLYENHRETLIEAYKQTQWPDYEPEEVDDHILEELADLEHRQWMHWSKYVAENHDIPDKLREKWEQNWKPYSELSEELKEKDRKWARKALKTIREGENQSC